MTKEQVREILRTLEADPELKAEVMAMLLSPPVAKEQLRAVVRTLQADPAFKAEVTGILSSPPAAVDGRFEQMLAHIATLREEGNARAAASDKRFEEWKAASDKGIAEGKAEWKEYREASDKRFEEWKAEWKEYREASDKRFQEGKAESDKRIAEGKAEWKAESDKRIAEGKAEWKEYREASDKRFQESRAASDKWFNERFDRHERYMIRLAEMNRLTVIHQLGGYRRRAGRDLEDTLAGLLRVTLGPTGIRPQDVKPRQKFRDADGAQHEVDLVVRDDAQYVMEVSWRRPEGGLAALVRKMDAAIAHWSLHNAKKVLVVIEKEPGLAEECEQLGVALV